MSECEGSQSYGGRLSASIVLETCACKVHDETDAANATPLHSPADAGLVGAMLVSKAAAPLCRCFNNMTSTQLQTGIALTGRPSHANWMADWLGARNNA